MADKTTHFVFLFLLPAAGEYTHTTDKQKQQKQHVVLHTHRELTNLKHIISIFSKTTLPISLKFRHGK